MNAAGLRAFERASQKAAEAVYPGRVRFGGVTYSVALYYGPIERRLDDAEGGGSVWEQGMFFDLAKCNLATEPVTGTVVSDADTGEMYVIESVDGRGAQDMAWLVACRKHPE